jgi:hypothetical protein
MQAFRQIAGPGLPEARWIYTPTSSDFPFLRDVTGRSCLPSHPLMYSRMGAVESIPAREGILMSSDASSII